MLTAIPGRGRITRVIIGNDTAWAASGVRCALVPLRADARGPSAAPWDPPVPDETPVPVVSQVDVVLPHAGRPHATGAVLTVRDAATARELADAFTRAAQMLELQAPAGSLSTVALTVEDLAG